MWYIVAYTAGMFVMILVVALMEEGDNSTSSEYQKALEGQLKKANERGNELKVALDESIDLANHALLAYRVVADEADHYAMCASQWEDRCITAEMLNEF